MFPKRPSFELTNKKFRKKLYVFGPKYLGPKQVTQYLDLKFKCLCTFFTKIKRNSNHDKNVFDGSQ